MPTPWLQITRPISNCSPERKSKVGSSLKVEFESLAAAYLRLAEQAERNEALIVEFELPRKEKRNPKA
jgi:hypothetical protein